MYRRQPALQLCCLFPEQYRKPVCLYRSVPLETPLVVCQWKRALHLDCMGCNFA